MTDRLGQFIDVGIFIIIIPIWPFFIYRVIMDYMINYLRIFLKNW